MVYFLRRRNLAGQYLKFASQPVTSRAPRSAIPPTGENQLRRTHPVSLYIPGGWGYESVRHRRTYPGCPKFKFASQLVTSLTQQRYIPPTGKSHPRLTNTPRERTPPEASEALQGAPADFFYAHQPHLSPSSAIPPTGLQELAKANTPL